MNGEAFRLSAYSNSRASIASNPTSVSVNRNFNKNFSHDYTRSRNNFNNFKIFKNSSNQNNLHLNSNINSNRSIQSASINPEYMSRT